MKKTANASKTTLRTTNVLFIEEDDDQWLLIQQIMRKSLPKLTLVRATGLQQAAGLLDQGRHQEWELPQLILLSLYLPTAEEGFQVLKHLKAKEGLIRRIPVVMLSDSTDAAHIAQAYELGVSAYMPKPRDAGEWATYFELLRTYWFETVTLPPVQYGR